MLQKSKASEVDFIFEIKGAPETNVLRFGTSEQLSKISFLLDKEDKKR